MATMGSCDAFTCFYLLLFGLVFIAALCSAAAAVPRPALTCGALAAYLHGPTASRTAFPRA